MATSIELSDKLSSLVSSMKTNLPANIYTQLMSSVFAIQKCLKEESVTSSTEEESVTSSTEGSDVDQSEDDCTSDVDDCNGHTTEYEFCNKSIDDFIHCQNFISVVRVFPMLEVLYLARHGIASPFYNTVQTYIDYEEQEQTEERAGFVKLFIELYLYVKDPDYKNVILVSIVDYLFKNGDIFIAYPSIGNVMYNMVLHMQLDLATSCDFADQLFSISDDFLSALKCYST